MKLLIGGTFSVWKGTPGNMEYWGSFHNHVTDYGLNTLVTKSLDDLMAELHVGSGNTAPADGDTALDSEIASTTNKTSTHVYNTTYGYVGRRRNFTFSAGAAEGTLAELGLSDGTSLFNRQLFLDQYGNNTTITVGAAETLEVLCEVRFYTPDAVNVKAALSTFTIGSETFDCNFSAGRGLFYAGGNTSLWSACLWLPSHSFGWLTNSNLSWRLVHTTADYSSGDSGVNTSPSSGTAPDAITQSSYVSDSFELDFEFEWTAGTLAANNYDLLTCNQGVYYDYKLLEFGISSPYNQDAETAWQDSHLYTLGDKFTSAAGDFIYEVTTGGTSHTSAPTWPTTVGGTVTDGGGVEYECVAPLLRVEVTETLTLTVTLSWGRET